MLLEGVADRYECRIAVKFRGEHSRMPGPRQPGSRAAVDSVDPPAGIDEVAPSAIPSRWQERVSCAARVSRARIESP